MKFASLTDLGQTGKLNQDLFKQPDVQKVLEDFLEKGHGKKAFIGEVRQYGGKDWVKTQDGWKLKEKHEASNKMSHKVGDKVVATDPEGNSTQGKVSKLIDDNQVLVEDESGAGAIFHKDSIKPYVDQNEIALPPGVRPADNFKSYLSVKGFSFDKVSNLFTKDGKYYKISLESEGPQLKRVNFNADEKAKNDLQEELDNVLNIRDLQKAQNEEHANNIIKAEAILGSDSPAIKAGKEALAANQAIEKALTEKAVELENQLKKQSKDYTSGSSYAGGFTDEEHDEKAILNTLYISKNASLTNVYKAVNEAINKRKEVLTSRDYKALKRIFPDFDLSKLSQKQYRV